MALPKPSTFTPTDAHREDTRLCRACLQGCSSIGLRTPIARACRSGAPRKSQDLRIKISGGFGPGLLAGSFDKLAVDERGSGADQGDQVWCVDLAPAGLG